MAHEFIATMHHRWNAWFVYLVAATLCITLHWYYIWLAQGHESSSSFTAMYATEALEHYSNTTASSMIKCAMKCRASTEGSCIGCQYQRGKECLLYNASVYGHLSVMWSPHAMVIHACMYLLSDETHFDPSILHSFGFRDFLYQITCMSELLLHFFLTTPFYLPILPTFTFASKIHHLMTVKKPLRKG